MHAVLLHDTGMPIGFATRKQIGQPAADEVLVRVHATSLNSQTGKSGVERHNPIQRPIATEANKERKVRRSTRAHIGN